MQKFTLSINERIAMIQIPPKEGNYTDQLVWSGILRKTYVPRSLAQDMPRDIYNGIDEEASEKASVEFEFTDIEIDVFRSAVDKIKNDNKVSQSIVSIVKKVIELPTASERKKEERKEVFGK